ncbi:MAG: TOBE domain-containing protein, partial [Chloroflexota bacterium]|nr:TOBE domain-containing protein [Chloroflexota bacterium]
LRGVIAQENGETLFVTGDGVVRMPLGRRDLAAGTAVELGLRPRDLALGETPGMATLRGQVYVVEPLGRQREVTVQLGEQRVALVTPHEDVAVDSLVTISAPHDRLLLFNAASGVRISAVGDLEPGVAAAGATAHG